MTTSNHPGANAQYRADIDGLRAIAVLGVIAFHSGLPGFGGGFVGVDVFFVISGFLITGLLNAELERTGTISFSAFFARRIRRLMPALVVVVLFSLLVAMWSMLPKEVHRLGKSAQALGIVVANLHFKNFTGGYFDPSTDLMPLLHTWSLAVEEQYYLVWPPLLLLLHRIHGPHSAVNFQRNLVIFLVVAALLSFASSVWQTARNQPAAFYLMPYRAWEFAAGALICHWQPVLERRIGARGGSLLTGIGLVLIFGTMMSPLDSARFPGAIAAVPVLGSALVIVGGLHRDAMLSHRILGHRVPVSIGLVSYSLYLWHWPLLALERDYFLGRHDPLNDGASIALSFVLALLSYRLIERPIRERRPGPFADTRGTLRVGLLMSLLVIISASGVMEWSKQANAKLVATFGRDIPDISDRCDEHGGEALAASEKCLVGRAPDPVRVAVWGDSHAGHFGDAMNSVSTNLVVRSLIREVGACPPLTGAIPFKHDEAVFLCGQFNENVLSEILASPHPLAGVVLGGRWNLYLAQPVTEPGGTYPYALLPNWHQYKQSVSGIHVGQAPLDTPGSAKTMQETLHATLTALTGKGLRVLIVAPIPELYFHGPQCLYHHEAADCAIPRERVELRRKHAMQSLRAAAAGMDAVRIWDPIDEFCDSKTCYAMRDGISLYSDDNHISGRMSRALEPKLQPYVEWMLEAR